jgi:lipopolysaccharide transport system permease protein
MAITASHENTARIVLEAGQTDRRYWRDLWMYRELFTTLARRDLAVRYKQTVIGVTWALLRPLLTAGILTLVLGRIARLPSEGDVPYALMVFTGMLPWFLFAGVLSDASASLVSNANLVGKVYFPRLVIPTAAAVVALVEFGINLLLLAGMMLAYGVAPTWRVMLLPAFALLAVLASLGPALLVTALNVRYRDFRHIIPFLVQFGLYVSPVGFSSTVVPEKWRFLYSTNPLVGVIDGFRWSVLGTSQLYIPGFLTSLAIVSLLLWCGIAYFRRTERTFADHI